MINNAQMYVIIIKSEYASTKKLKYFLIFQFEKKTIFTLI